MATKGYAVVTGGGMGIGAALCGQLAKEGYDVLVNYSNSKARAQQLADALKKQYGVKTAIFQADVASHAQVKEMRDFAVATFGEQLAVLVNNAGLANRKPFLEMRPEEYERLIAVDLFGSFHCCSLFVPLMVKNNFGRVIMISSTAGFAPVPMQADYAAAKAAQIGFARSVAVEWGAHNITVNVIAPGYIVTEGTAAEGPELQEMIKGMSPIKQVGHVEDVQEAFSYLINSKTMTGQSIAPNCGIFMF